jgi:hypothetical protein
MSRPGASSRSSFKCFSVRSLTCQAIFAGPSAEARAKAILKNQKKNGTALTGRAAVLKRTADLRRLSGLDSSSTDALVAAVGKPGQIFYTTRKAQHDCPLPKLPEGAHVLVSAMASGSIDPTTVELKPCVPAPIPNSSLRGSREGSVVGAGWAQRLIGLRTEPAKVLVPGGLAARLVALRGSNPAGKEAPNTSLSRKVFPR